MDSSYIAQLIEAEKRAEHILETARKNWQDKIAEGREAALDMCARFRESEEKKCEARIAQLRRDGAINQKELDAEDLKRKSIEKGFRSGRDDAFDFLVKKVMTINTNVDEETKHFLRSESRLSEAAKNSAN